MKKIKMCLILFLVIFLSGCSGVYELTINEDLSIIEKASLSIKKEDYTYDKILDLLKEYNVSETDYSINTTDNMVKVSFTKKFESFDDYVLNSKLYPNIVNSINYKNVDKRFSIDTSAIISSSMKNNDNIYNNYDIDLLMIKIQTPLKVLSSNADDNAYDTDTWNFKNGVSKKDIRIEISTESFSNNLRYILVLTIIGLIVVIFSVLAIIRFKKANKI